MYIFDDSIQLDGSILYDVSIQYDISIQCDDSTQVDEFAARLMPSSRSVGARTLGVN